jgi:hypothetical protein
MDIVGSYGFANANSTIDTAVSMRDLSKYKQLREQAIKSADGSIICGTIQCS